MVVCNVNAKAAKSRHGAAMVKEIKFKNDHFYFVRFFIIFIYVAAFILLWVGFVLCTYTIKDIIMAIIGLIVIIVSSVWGFFKTGTKYAVIFMDSKIKIFSKTYSLSNLKYVELIPWTAVLKPKKDKLYGYIIFYFEKPNKSKFKKIMIHGGWIENHKKFVKTLKDYGIKYGVRRY